jgi:hypothetical protein
VTIAPGWNGPAGPFQPGAIVTFHISIDNYK